MTQQRSNTFGFRVACAISMTVVLCLGLIWRSPRVGLSPWIAKYGADALWSLLVFLGFSFMTVRMPPVRLALVTFAFCCVVEFSQLYHAPWIDSIRATLPGRLILGSVFNWPDIPAYAFGIGCGFILLRWIRLKTDLPSLSSDS